MIKLILSWLIIIGIAFFLFSDKGIYYDELQNTCIVKYTQNGKTQESPIETMQDTK